VISRPPKTMTPEEEDAYYTAHAEPVPRWLRALFALPRRAIVAIGKRKPETRADTAAIRPVSACNIDKADRNPTAEAYSPGTTDIREEAFACRLSSQTSRSDPVM